MLHIPTEASQQKMRPFRFLKIVSDAKIAPLTVEGDPVSVLQTLDDPLPEDAEEATMILGGLSGSVFHDDTFVIDGDATVYTVDIVRTANEAGALYLTFTPGILAEVPLGTEVTFTQTGQRGEAELRTILVISK